VAEADSAVAQATNWLSITDSVIYYDMEPYAPPSGDTTCSPAVRSFLAGWVTELHSKGFETAGVYGLDRSSNVTDFAAVVPIPDAVWLTYLDGSTYQNASVGDLQFLGGNWNNNQLIHQYCFGSACAGTWGQVSINIDGDVQDGPVVPGQYLPAPTLVSPANASTGVSPTPFFSWNAVSDATSGYRLMVASAPSAFPVAPDAQACNSCLLNVTVGSNSYLAGAGVLQPNVTYYWQVHGRGQLVGYWSSPWSFTTGSSSNPLPTVVSSPATAIAIATTTLNGTANPNGSATMAWFEYGTDSGLSTPTLTPSQPAGSGAVVQAFSANLTGLSGSTTYYFRAVATNANGTSKGLILNFPTLAPVAPAVSTNAATAPGANGATMNGQLNPNGSPSIGWFEYGTSSTPSTFTLTPSQPIGSDSVSHPFNWTQSGLSPGTTYYYRAAGSNSGGATEAAAILSFVTTSSASAVVTTGSPASLTSSNATLSGTINPAGASGTAYFRYGTDPTMTSYYTTSSQNVTANSTTQAFSSAVGVATNTTYYCQMVFYNSGNSTNQLGSTVSFTTLQSVQTTLAASLITSGGATLNGTVDPNGASGTAYFRYGTDPTMTSYYTTSSQNVTANSTTQAFSSAVGLGTNTTYYCQLVFYNYGNSANQLGNIVSLATLQSVETTLAASSITSGSATLNGTINPAGASGSAYFRYGTDPTMTSYNTTSSQNVTANSTAQAFSASVSLYTNITYYQMVFYNSWNGSTQLGSIVSVTTLQSVETTLAASSITSSSATLNGTINPAGSPGTAFFRISTDPTLTSYNTTSSQNVTANSTTQAFSSVMGLATNTAYYYQMVFYNSGNSTNQPGSIVSVTTLQSVETTLAASSITSSSATLNGTVNPAGSSGTAYFEYGTDPTMTSYNSTSGQTVTANSTTQAFSATVSSLTSGNTYYYRMVFRSAPTNNNQPGNTLSFTAQAGVNVSPPSVNFPNQLMGSTSSTQTISITNAGAATVSISIAKSGSNSGDFGESNNCGSSLNSGSSCTVQVTFAPTAAGPRKSSIVVSVGASNSSVILTGVGTEVSVLPPSLNFASQPVGTASASQLITLTNHSGTELNIWQIIVQGLNAGDFSVATTCGNTLAALGSCTVSVTFTPAATGPRTATVLFSDDGGGGPQAVPLSGTGT
jgi:hypothetical protein